ncbi:hypothetical protein C2845_PM11G25950 [Panicum miliaceum]|uniref:non-specific serine/threonine protein kinase n=1 Tax=Panicum miliaceum TaxID=4540 RepID=A0A3L6RTF9_PANMI|nr:hypothetical protein C2845_PM11G25950 [Panicum miliaceum]
MKNFLRKLHIGEGSSDGGSSPSPPPSRKGGSGGGGVHHHHQPHHDQRQQPSAVSSWLDSVPTRPPPPIPVEAEVPTSASASFGVGAEERSARQSAAAERRRSQQEEVERRRSQEEEVLRERRRLQEEEMGKERRRSQEEDEVEERVIRESSEAEERKREREKEEDDLEAYQIQLVLEMSARDNPEEMEIEVAKQLSLGFCPPQTSPAEVLAARYWNFNALTYDDKIPDGFYDLFCVANGPASVTMPSFGELRAQPFSHKVNWEVMLIHRGEDPELMKLQQEALIMALDLQSRTSESVGNALVKRLASLVARHMGGVFDPESMSVKYQNMLNSLRSSIGSVVVPLGQLKIGLARHRALLFKVLADGLDVPCRLLKGRQYTGSDDGALNIVKFKDGREFIVDLVADPGTLIPSDGAVLSTDLDENFVADNHHLKKVETTNLLGSSFSGASSSAYGSFDYELLDRRSPSDTDGPTTNQTSNQQSMLSSSFEKLSVSTCTSESRPIINESTNADYIMVAKNKEKSIAPVDSSSSSPSASDMGSTPAVRRMKVKDISEYMINAAKENPQLAQKIHEVLRENGVVAPPDLFSEDSMEEPKDLIVYDTTLFQSKDEMKRTMNEFESRKYTDSGHAPSLPYHPGHELQPKVVPHRTSLESLKPVEGNELVEKGGDDFWDKDNIEADHAQDNALDQEIPQEAERTSDKSSGTESAKSDLALEDVAEFEIQWEEIAIGERIGLGSFGEVYRGEWHGTEVAVKKFLQQDLSGDALEEFRTEVRIMKRLRHPNVVLFMGAITRVPNLSIVTEFLPRGSLFRLIHRPNNQLDERKRLRMALDVARGMNYLHNCSPVIVHRDLKSPNLLVDKNWVVKVCDFGLSRMKNKTFLSSRSTAGTVLINFLHRAPCIWKRNEIFEVTSWFKCYLKSLLNNCANEQAEWMAPEVLRNEPSDEKCDVFSYGVILWELCTLLQPWEGMNAMQVVGAVGFQNRRLDIPDNIDPAIAEIIVKCWHTDPKLRPSFADIMAALKPLLKNLTSNQAPKAESTTNR